MNEKQIPHKHATLIKAWADGAEIQCNGLINGWKSVEGPSWDKNLEYRVKPEKIPDMVVNTLMSFKGEWKTPNVYCSWNGDVMPAAYRHNLTEKYELIRYVFDGETGKLKSVKKMIKEEI